MKTMKTLRGLGLFLVSITPVLGTSVFADVANDGGASATGAASGTGAVVPAKSLDDKINTFIEPATKQIGEIVFWTVNIGGQDVPFVLIWLVVGAIVFTLYFRFINIRGFKLSLDIV
ncbi:uncharacterized protein METZ01_LOCUS467924, partial [marine metagenome]